MTVLGDHVECNRHHVCNAVFYCEVCQTRFEKKRAMINKMIERKTSGSAKKSATVTSLATEISSVRNTDSRHGSQVSSMGNGTESQLLSKDR